MHAWVRRVLPMWRKQDKQLAKVRADTARTEAELSRLRAQRPAVEHTGAVISTALEQNGFANLFRQSITGEKA